MEPSKTYNHLVFGLITVFWSGIMTVFNILFFQSQNLEITLDIMLVIANIIFLQILVSSWKSYMHNTKYIMEQQQKIYEQIVEMKTRDETVKELVRIIGIPTPTSYKKSRIKMTIVTLIGCFACALSIYISLAPYLK